jgi:uncharacterized protein (UPF0332 family)
VNPRDFQTLAENLVKEPGAAQNRAAIGRSYYAVFNVAAGLLRGANFKILENAAAHLEVTRLLKASENDDVKRAGRQIGEMRSVRNKADYEMDRQDVERDATAATLVAAGRRCIEVLDAAFSGSDRGSIVAAMQAWLKRIAPGEP